MAARQLGNTDMLITPIGLGTWAMGGENWTAGWGPQDDKDSIATIHRAIELGINWIDTAAVYGIGHAEEVVGQALKGLAERPYVFTKCGRKAEPDGIKGVLRPDFIRSDVENSLRRLQIDVIDLCQLHWPQPDSDIELGWQALLDLQKEGKIRYAGVSNFNVSQMERLQAIAPVSSLQPPYSLIRRGVEEDILDYCQASGIGVIVYAPMASGILSGTMTRERIQNLPESDWRHRSAELQEPRLSRNLELVELLREVGNRHNATPGEVAIAWTLVQPAVTGAIVGGRRPEQLDTMTGAVDLALDQEDLARISAFLKEHP